MIKTIFFLFALVAVSNAAVRKAEFTGGYIIQGKSATSVSVSKNILGQQEIEWKREFGNNSLTVYVSHIFEDTGLLETVELSNLCAEYPRASFENGIKRFVLTKLRGTNRCPIKKGKKVIRYPITNTFEVPTANTICGPLISTIQIVRNKKSDSDNARLLLSTQFRGVISGC